MNAIKATAIIKLKTGLIVKYEPDEWCSYVGSDTAFIMICPPRHEGSERQEVYPYSIVKSFTIQFD